MKYLLLSILLTFTTLLVAQSEGNYAIQEKTTINTDPPCSVCSPWQYTQSDSTLYRWNGNNWIDFQAGISGTGDIIQSVIYTGTDNQVRITTDQDTHDFFVTPSTIKSTQIYTIGATTHPIGTAIGTLFAGLDGTETKVTAGSNITVSGTGTDGDPYVVSVGGTAADSYAWYSTIDDIVLYSTNDPTTWISETSAQEYTITVPAGEKLERIAYLTSNGLNRNASTNATIFVINTSATANTNTSYLNTFTPTVSMNNNSGNIVPVGIGGSPTVVAAAPAAGARTLTIQGITGVVDGTTRIQLNNLSSY